MQTGARAARRRRIAVLATGAVIICLAALAATLTHSRWSGSEAARHGQPVIRLVRVSAGQYGQAISDIFGPAIVLNDKLAESEQRSHGLLAIGDAEVSITPAAFESADVAALSIAKQVTNAENRNTLIACKPALDNGPDDACAKGFLSRVGRLLYRRSLSDSELSIQVSVAHAAALQANDFYQGLSASLATMLTAPDFLFRIEVAEPESAGKYRLTAYSKASRLSALLWNSNPDDQLLTAAEHGELDSGRGLQRQIDRMMASPKLQNGVRAFFGDMLEFDKFATLEKDPAIYPRYTSGIDADIREQAQRVLVDVLVTKHEDFRDLFSTRETFLTPALAALQDVVLPENNQNDEPDKWMRYEYPPGDPRAGFLALPAFTALNSHPGASSPTLRGKAVKEDLMCQSVPPPPPNVDFSLFNSPKAGATARDRLQAHATVPMCAGCHKLMDPIGLAFEHFDGSGRWRSTEQSHEIDTHVQFEGARYAGLSELSQAIGQDPTVESCLVHRLYSYGVARPLTASDRPTTDELSKRFDKSGRKFPELLRLVAESKQLYELEAPKGRPMNEATKALLSRAANGESR